MKTILSVFLACLMAVGLAACARPLSIGEEEAFAILTELVPLSYEINDMFFGEGLPAAEPPEERPGKVSYRAVSDDCGYRTVAEMMAAAERVYSERYLKSLYVTVFAGNENDAEAGELIKDKI